MAGSIKSNVLFCLISLVSISTSAQTKVAVIPMFGDDVANEKVIFITKVRYDGDLVSVANALTGVSGITDGLIAGDALCQADADALDSKVKGKTFKAWLGPASPDHLAAGARPFNIYDLPYVTPNGDQYAPSYTAMLKNPWTFLKTSADGTDVTSPIERDSIWTARQPDGVASSDLPVHTCNAWTSSDISFQAFDFREIRLADQSYGAEYDYNFCNLPARLICMEQ